MSYRRPDGHELLDVRDGCHRGRTAGSTVGVPTELVHVREVQGGSPRRASARTGFKPRAHTSLSKAQCRPSLSREAD